MAITGTPAVDAATMRLLDLQIGATFTITVNDLPYSTLSCVVVAEVQHIPTINDSDQAGNSGNDVSSSGLLLDYTSYATLYKVGVLSSGSKVDPTLPINHAWLRTSNDPVALAQVRTALTRPGLGLENLYDRRMLIESMRADPLYLGLLLILIVGQPPLCC